MVKIGDNPSLSMKINGNRRKDLNDMFTLVL